MQLLINSVRAFQIVFVHYIRYNFVTLADIYNQLHLWVQQLRAIAQTGLAFDPGVYDKERYEELLHLASEIAATDGGLRPDAALAERLYAKWRAEVEPGIPGYVTPKIGVGAIVFNDRDELLLIKRPSGLWFIPTGWADVGYSPAQVAAKEVREETGFEVTPERLIGVYDVRQLLETEEPVQLYSLVFLCRLDGGKLAPPSHEALDAGFFGHENLPRPLARTDLNWVDHAFAAHRGELKDTFFDPL